MKRHHALVKLSRDHYHGLLLAQQIKTGAAPYKGYPTDLEGKITFLFSEYEQKLKPHFALEENVLFPMAAKKSEELSTLVNELIKEHRQLFSMIENVPRSKDQPQALNEIGVLLEQHIRKEERKLFEMVQQTFSEEEIKVLEYKMIQ